jgi:uncharacterized protein YdeI (YjbR/CyaY-like superfamily)
VRKAITTGVAPSAAGRGANRRHGVIIGPMPRQDAPTFEPADRDAWRAWLEVNHAQPSGHWLILRRPSRSGPGLDYESAVLEALCYGWIDSTAGRVDDSRWRVWFAPRKARGVWSASNKARIETLVADGRMRPAGLAAIERAKANGSWSILDTVERLEVPDDLQRAFDATPPAAAEFAAFAPSVRKGQLYWIAQARRPETRAARIAEVAAAAARGKPARS